MKSLKAYALLFVFLMVGIVGNGLANDAKTEIEPPGAKVIHSEVITTDAFQMNATVITVTLDQFGNVLSVSIPDEGPGAYQNRNVAVENGTVDWRGDQISYHATYMIAYKYILEGNYSKLFPLARDAVPHAFPNPMSLDVISDFILTGLQTDYVMRC